jgi:hypothetical protein
LGLVLMVEKNEEKDRFELTRREFVIGSAGVTLAIIGSTAILSGCSSSGGSTGAQGDVEPTELDVSTDQVVDSSDFSELDASKCVSLTTEYDLQIGTVGHMDGDSLAAMLYPGDSTDVLVQIGLLPVLSGGMSSVLSTPLSKSEGYQIYDVRANDQVIVWVECNLHTDDWRLYVAPVQSSSSIGAPNMVDQGDADFDPPMLCVSGSRAFWTYMPSEDGGASDSDSYLKYADSGSSKAGVVYTSHGRMITNPQASDGIVTIVPRADTQSTRYQLTAIDASTGDVVAAELLPSSMQAYDAIYLDGSFVFSIEKSYNYDSGISDFGTYAPIDDSTYMRFNRTPMDTPVKCGKYLFIKSTKSVVGLDLSSQSFFAIDTVSGCESYGDFLLSTGTSDNVVVYTSVPKGDGSGDGNVHVRVFSVL